MIIEAICIAWLLTVVCEDDQLQWQDPVPDPVQSFTIHLVYGGVGYDVPQGVEHHLVGCFDGTIRVSTINSEGVESENPLFFRWEGTAGYDTLGLEATGRFMAWETQQLPETGCR